MRRVNEAARQGQHFICGPWPHSGSLFIVAGDVNFGPNAAGGPGPVVRGLTRWRMAEEEMSARVTCFSSISISREKI